MAITIPKGKLARIFVDGSSAIGDIPLILEDSLTLNLSSTFEPLLNTRANPIIDVIGNLSADFLGFGFSSQFTKQGIQIWKGTQPITMNFTFNFYMGMADKWDAELEVYNPIMALAKIPLPTIEKTTGFFLVPPGPSLKSQFFPSEQEGTQRGKQISVEIGEMVRFPSAIIPKAEPTFSTEVDEEGYPIQGSINLDIQTIDIATVELLDKNISSEELFGGTLADFILGR